MVHSFNSSEIRPVGSQLFSIRHPRTRSRIDPPYPSYALQYPIPPTEDCRKFLEEFCKLESGSEQMSRIDARIKELNEENMKNIADMAKTADNIMKLTKLHMKLIDDDIITNKDRNITMLQRHIETIKKLMKTQRRSKM